MGRPFNYSGNCHCGAFCFDLSLAAPLPHPFAWDSLPQSPSSTTSSSLSSTSPSSSASHPLPLPLPLYACPCAICTMKGCILLPVAPNLPATTTTTTEAASSPLTGKTASTPADAGSHVVKFTVTRGAGEDGLGLGPLVDFVVPAHRGRHRFCTTCGTTVAIVENAGADHGNGDGGVVRVLALNVRAVRHGRQLARRPPASIVGDSATTPAPPAPSLPPAAPLWELPPLLALDLRTAGGESRLAPAQSLNDSHAIESFAAVAAAAAAHEGERVYAGGCFCRAVTYRVRTLPLDDPAVDVKECDCSICVRMGSILTYPRPLDRVALHQTPADALVSYFYALGTKFCGFQFCRVCGVNTCNWITGPPAEVLAAGTEEFRAVVREKVTIKPVNVRTMDFYLGLGGATGTVEDQEEELARFLARIDQTTIGSERGEVYVVPTL
ncbi:hypothetical protein DFJ73DRAFT_776134 [Zopfochytrium polystomum]|nr:hypothetical protein DFJ73DRAFT_776134 [Zopfochytrium polystomum]